MGDQSWFSASKNDDLDRRLIADGQVVFWRELQFKIIKL